MEITALYALFKTHPVVTTDTRNCPQGSIFFALRGASFNGNAFATQALSKGCAYAVIDDPTYADATNEQLILVSDTLTTLQQLAHHHRMQLGTHIIGVTGTNGKTTTKELIATVLSKRYQVLYTQGNMNNHIGVPLTLLRLTAAHDVAVIEMGANHPGEIATLAQIAAPNDGVITNVGKAHLEGFGSFEGVLRTKGELYDYLRRVEHSRVFIHCNNPHLQNIAHHLHTISYGKLSAGSAATVMGEVTMCNPYLTFIWGVAGEPMQEVHTHMIGAYNIDNMLAAATIGHTFGLHAADISDALASYVPQNNRSQLTHTTHNHLIVDAYNANPTSMNAALLNFKDMAVAHKMVILGDMKELGESSAAEHTRIIELLGSCALNKVWLVGEQFTALRPPYRCFANVDAVKVALATEKIADHYILIKGSNSMKLATLVELL